MTELTRPAQGWPTNKPHNPDHQRWGADDCDACTAEAYEPYEALVAAADIMGWRPPDPEPAPDVSWVAFEELGPLGGVREVRPGAGGPPSGR